MKRRGSLKKNPSQPASWALGLGLFMALGCSTTQVAPPAPPTPPSYTNVPHPAGMDVGDLQEIFRMDGAPKNLEFAQNCDQDFIKLRVATDSEKEVLEGTRELLRRDPIAYHWCFYGKLLTLENEMQKNTYVDERQKLVLDTFDFIVPISKGFAHEFHDSRYLRWAVHKYKKLSEWLFYRKVDLTPAGTAELVEISNPFGLWRDSFGGSPVLDKYHIVEPLSAGELGGGKAPEGGSTAPVTASLVPSTPVVPVSSAVASFGDSVSDSATTSNVTAGELQSTFEEPAASTLEASSIPAQPARDVAAITPKQTVTPQTVTPQTPAAAAPQSLASQAPLADDDIPSDTPSAVASPQAAVLPQKITPPVVTQKTAPTAVAPAQASTSSLPSAKVTSPAKPVTPPAAAPAPLADDDIPNDTPQVVAAAPPPQPKPKPSPSPKASPKPIPSPVALKVTAKSAAPVLTQSKSTVVTKAVAPKAPVPKAPVAKAPTLPFDETDIPAN